MAEKTESVRIPSALMKKVRKRSRDSGVRISFLVALALRTFLNRAGVAR